MIIARWLSDKYKPIVVGLEWVERCQRGNCHAKEEDYLVDLASIPDENFKVSICLDSRTLLISVLQRGRSKIPKSLTIDSYDGSFEELADSSIGFPSIGGGCH